MHRDWLQRLNAAVESSGSLLCAGLDPDIEKIPRIFESNSLPEERILPFVSAFIDLSIDAVCAYKIQKAFFDSFESGQLLLRLAIDKIRSLGPERLIILDCKIGDIENTMHTYLNNLFALGVDAIVVNPYMGTDVLIPFRQHPNRAAAVLVRTSNSGAGVVQDLETAHGTPLWRHVLDLVIEEWESSKQVFPILSSHAGNGLLELRQSIPDEMPILFAGFGAQGGRVEAIPPLLNSKRAGVIVNSSRALLYPHHERPADWPESARAAILNAKERINSCR